MSMVYKKYLKRLFDIIISGILILICFPIFLILFVIVKIESKGSFFFFQKRVGYNGKIFKVIKIRTMVCESRDPNVQVFHNSPDITRIGRILRRVKLDELTQIVNVFIGDMSIVGPRPGLVSQLKDYNVDGLKRLEVRPGLTGLAQVNGNVFLSWSERWIYDRIYVEKLSFFMDCSIIFKTFGILILGEDKFIKRP